MTRREAHKWLVFVQQNKKRGLSLAKSNDFKRVAKKKYYVIYRIHFRSACRAMKYDLRKSCDLPF